MSQTTWNDPGYHVSEPNTESENFQTMNTVYKIEKVKKGRTNGKKKNKKLFEVLQTDYMEKNDNDPIIAKNADSVEPFSSMFKETVIEPMGASYPGDYDCGDNVNDDKLSEEKAQMNDAIEEMYQYCVFMNHFMAAAFLAGLSGKKNVLDNYNNFKAWQRKIYRKPCSSKSNAGGPSNCDVDILSNHLAYFEALLFSSIFVYNWFYLIYYMKVENIEPYCIRMDTLKDIAEDPKYSLLWIFIFVFEYAFFFVEKLNVFMLDTIGKITPTFFTSSTMLFFLLFRATYIIALNFASYLKDFLISILSGTNIAFNALLYSIIVILFVTSILNYNTEEEVRMSKSVLTGNKTAISAIKLLFNSTALQFIRHLIRFIIISIFSVPFAGILCSAYLFIYSLFGIAIYNGVTKTMWENLYFFPFFTGTVCELFVGTKREHTIYGKINAYILKTSIRPDSPPDYCEDDGTSWTTPFKKVYRFIIKCLSFITNVAFIRALTLSFCALIAHHIYDSSAKMSGFSTIFGQPLRTVMPVIYSVVLLFIIIGYFGLDNDDIKHLKDKIFKDFKQNFDFVDTPPNYDGLAEKQDGLISNYRNTFDTSKKLAIPLVANPLVEK
jgi:hypothetical protein